MILGIDYGQKKIGLALSDETGLVASPIHMIRIASDEEAISKIFEIVKAKYVTEIVVGIPTGYNNIDSPQTKIVREFIVLLSEIIKIKVNEWDETYSTQIAEKGLSKKQKLNSDSYAAAIILQEFLDYQRYEKNR